MISRRKGRRTTKKRSAKNRYAKKRSSMRGGTMLAWSPAPVEALLPSAKSILGPADVNYVQNRAYYSSKDAYVNGHGCPGTKCGITAAEGIYTNDPYSHLQGGGRKRGRHYRKKRVTFGGQGYTSTGPVNRITGPYAGAGLTEVYQNDIPVQSDTSIPHKFPFPNGDSAMPDNMVTNFGSSLLAGGGRGRKYKKNTKRHTRRKMRGGMMDLYPEQFTPAANIISDRQPYSNEPISFGYSSGGILNANDSGQASPPPYTPYKNCGIYSRK